MVTAALVVALVALGGDFVVLLTENSQLDQNKASLSSQITVLQYAIGSLQSQLSQSQQAQNSDALQISTLQSDLRNVQSQLDNVIAEFNSNMLSNLAFQDQTYTQLQGVSVSLSVLTAKLNALTPEAPNSILAIINHTYDNATGTFTFVVQNTRNFTVYAQMSVQMFTDESDCGLVGSYYSQVYAFPPESETVTQLSLASTLYEFTEPVCLGGPVTRINLYYMVGQFSGVSPIYEFDVVPGYFHS